LTFGVLGGDAPGELYPLEMLRAPEELNELNSGKDLTDTFVDVDHNRTVPSRPAEHNVLPVWTRAEMPVV